jgi:hypothetical protein
MQQVKEAPRVEPEHKRAHLSPVKAFALLAVLLAAAGAVLYFTRPQATPAPTGIPESDNFALTNDEAIDELKALSEIGISAVQEKRIGDLSRAFVEDGPLYNRSVDAISELQQDRVSDELVYKSLSALVERNTASKIVLIEERLIEPCFIDAKGDDVTGDPSLVKQRVQWTMARQGSDWRLFDAEVLHEEKLKRTRSDCG